MYLTHTHTHTMEYYSAINKKEILPFGTTWMELEGFILSNIKSDSGRQSVSIVYIIYMWNLINLNS